MNIVYLPGHHRVTAPRVAVKQEGGTGCEKEELLTRPIDIYVNPQYDLLGADEMICICLRQNLEKSVWDFSRFSKPCVNQVVLWCFLYRRQPPFNMGC